MSSYETHSEAPDVVFAGYKQAKDIGPGISSEEANKITKEARFNIMRTLDENIPKACQKIMLALPRIISSVSLSKTHSHSEPFFKAFMLKASAELPEKYYDVEVSLPDALKHQSFSNLLEFVSKRDLSVETEVRSEKNEDGVYEKFVCLIFSRNNNRNNQAQQYTQ